MVMNLEQARQNMLDNQLRPWEVLDSRVLEVFAQVRREDFVVPSYRKLAYADLSLPLGHGQSMMKPAMEGRMLQALNVQASDRVLEIGTGSGFITSCLAILASMGHVTSVELHADFVQTATQRLAQANIHNSQLVVGEAVLSWTPAQTFDVIVITGAVVTIHARMLHWLNMNGRLFAVCGHSPAQKALLLTHEGNGQYREESLFETGLPYLLHAEPPRHFVL
jgi:protein-L-isoaspartate(D-aspartate) O-methyltransferase